MAAIADIAEPGAAPALKNLIDEARLRAVAQVFAGLSPQFNTRRFLATALAGLDELSIMQRVHRIAESLHAGLPGGYREQLAVVGEAAPRLDGAFLNMGLADFVASYGLEDFTASMAALKQLTPFGTAEFAVRHFLRADLPRALKTMAQWSRDKNEHVRRLASEGSRPRLPWSFKLEALTADPGPLAPILDQLKADESLYVRRSVANSLNDITKDHPGWVFEHIRPWPLDEVNTAWVVKHALRGLIKKGDPRALKAIGAADTADAEVLGMSVAPARLAIGGTVDIGFTLRSTGSEPQRLVVDYAVHYVKKNGSASAKVFKIKTLTLEPGTSERIGTRRAVRNFTTRVHYAGLHAVEVLVNGRVLGSAAFELVAE